MLITSSTTTVNFYTGSEFVLRYQILNEEGDPVTLQGGEDITLYLATSYTDEELILEVPGTIYDQSEAKVMFQFNPQDTKDMVSRAYDFTITVDDWVAHQGKIGLLPRNPTGGES